MRFREDRMLTVEDVAALMKVSTCVLYEYIRSGSLPSYRLSRRSIRIRESGLWDWLDQCRLNGRDAVDDWTEEERFLTTDEVAELLKISKFSLYELIRSGSLPAYRLINKLYRIRESELWDWIDRQTVCVSAV